VVLVVTTVVYYLNPPPGSHGTAFRMIWGTATVGTATAVAARQLLARMREYRATGDRPTVGLETLANVLFIVAVLFAASYYALSRQAGQMSGISNLTDALYFSMTVLSTVGFGDIHPIGQFARVVVTLQMLFDLVFVGSAIGLVVSSIVTRRQGPGPPRS
jgi:voltage-gated potassium channel